LGLSLFEKEEYEDAIASYTKAINLAEISTHFNNRGLAYYYHGQVDEAKKDFDMAISKDPEDITIYLNRGNMHLSNKDFELAHEDYKTALTIEK
jgi:tetratricopeptide (TPR) repeat protein